MTDILVILACLYGIAVCLSWVACRFMGAFIAVGRGDILLLALLLPVVLQAQTWSSKDREQEVIQKTGGRYEFTAFNDLIVGERTQTLQVKPTWGLTVFRDTWTFSGTGANVDENGGEIRLQSGTDTNGTAQIHTVFRGQYRPGAEVQTGIGFRVEDYPASGQDAKVGYYDANNGFGFGVDNTGKYVFVRRGGSDTKVYQSDWNIDKMDGTGPSRHNLFFSSGVIVHPTLTWYGYGSMRWYVNFADPVGGNGEWLVHVATFSGQTSIVDPNLPIKAEVDNGASSGTSLDLYIGGRQLAQVGPEFTRNARIVTDSVVEYQIAAAQNVWEPLIVVREKLTHGPSGRANSVRARFRHIDVAADSNSLFKVTLSTEPSTGGTPSAWSDPEDWPENETSIEVKKQGGSLTVRNTGMAVARAIGVGGSGSNSTTMREEISLVLPFGQEVVVWAKKLDNVTTNVTVNIEIEEEW